MLFRSEEIKELQADNREFEAPLPYEVEIRALLDYSIPVSQWEWWRASEVAKYMPGNADARKVGKAISRVVDGGMGGMEKEKTPEKTSRTIHGTVEYFLPMRRFTSNWVGKVERR